MNGDQIQCRAARATPKNIQHTTYVVELSPKVPQHARFRKTNSDREVTKPCVYVGTTGLTPEVRFQKHKQGERANSFVERYGVRLLTKLYAYAIPMPCDAARDMEVELAIGYGVWQGSAERFAPQRCLSVLSAIQVSRPAARRDLRSNRVNKE